MDLDKVLYGGDYNPEQWLDRPDILEEDIASDANDTFRGGNRSAVGDGTRQSVDLFPAFGKKENTTLAGWIPSWIVWIRLAYRSFWQLHPVPDHSGWQRNTQRCSV